MAENEKEINDPGRNLEKKLFIEEMNQDRFNKTMGIVKDLEQYEPRAIKTLFNYKISEMLENE